MQNDVFKVNFDLDILEFLDTWNGDWTQERPQFYTAGRNVRIEDAKAMMRGSAQKLDLLCGHDRMPSMDDWGTCAEGCGQVSLGILCHNALAQAMDLGLPNWGSAAPPNDRRRREDDGAEIARLKIQKKAWRTKCFLKDNDRRLAAVLNAFIGVCVEHLIQRLDYLDEHHNRLLETCKVDTCPFRTCRRQLMEILQKGSGDGSMLEPVFQYFSDGYTYI